MLYNWRPSTLLPIPIILLFLPLIPRSLFTHYIDLPYTRVTLKLLTPPPLPERIRKAFSSTWDSIVLRSSLWGLNPSLDRFNHDWKKGKSQLLKGASKSPLHRDPLPFESILPFPTCFLSILRTGENSRWIDDWVKVGEEIVESR